MNGLIGSFTGSGAAQTNTPAQQTNAFAPQFGAPMTMVTGYGSSSSSATGSFAAPATVAVASTASVPGSVYAPPAPLVHYAKPASKRAKKVFNRFFSCHCQN